MSTDLEILQRAQSWESKTSRATVGQAHDDAGAAVRGEWR